MSANLRPPKFAGTIANGETKYVGIAVKDGALGCQILWLDATSSAVITLDLSSLDHVRAPVETAGTYHWTPSGVSIVGPTATAIGSSTVNVENVRQRRARLKIVAAAACNLEVHDSWDES